MSIMVLVRFADALALLLSCQGRRKHTGCRYWETKCMSHGPEYCR